MEQYFIQFKRRDGKFAVYDSITKNISIYQKSDLRAMPKRHIFDMSTTFGLKATEKDLIKYAELFEKWANQLKNNDIYSIDWVKFYLNKNVVIQTFKNLSNNESDLYDRIDATEAKWTNSCYNGGITYVSPGVYKNSYGYDYSFFYPKILASAHFKIPTKKGQEQILTEIPAKYNSIQLGYYKVKITSDHKDIKKIFAFSKEHTYTHTSLMFALFNKDAYNINIELIQNGKPNAYIFSEYITGDKLFGKWFETISKLKAAFPDNKLIKVLASSLWGQLTARNKIYKTEAEIETENLDVGFENRYKFLEMKFYREREVYQILDTENEFKYNIRLVSFLTAYGRNKAARLAQKDIDHVARIFTDGIAFDRPQIFDKVADRILDISSIHPEDKTTGFLYFVNNKVYTNFTEKTKILKSTINKIKSSHIRLCIP